MTSVFTKIIDGELPSEKVFENEHIIAIKDIHPIAPIHLLIIPKKFVSCLQDVPKEDLFIMAEIIRVAQELANKYGIADGYRLITNNGASAGQIVFHLHFHLIGGRQLGALG